MAAVLVVLVVLVVAALEEDFFLVLPDPVDALPGAVVAVVDDEPTSLGTCPSPAGDLLFFLPIAS